MNPTALQKKLKKLVAEGLTFEDCVAAFAVNRTTNPTAEATWFFHRNDMPRVSMDNETVVVETDECYWTMCWLQLHKHELEQVRSSAEWKKHCEQQRMKP